MICNFAAAETTRAQIDSWVDWAAEVDAAARQCAFPIARDKLPFDARVAVKGRETLDRLLAVLDGHLSSRTFLVGQTITLADIIVAWALIVPYLVVGLYCHSLRHHHFQKDESMHWHG